MTPDNGQELVLSIFSIPPPMPISSVFDPFEWTASSSNNLNFKRNLIGSGENQNLGAIQWRLGCWLHVPLPTNTTNFLLVFAFTPVRIFGWGGITWLILSLLATLPFPYPLLERQEYRPARRRSPPPPLPPPAPHRLLFNHEHTRIRQKTSYRNKKIDAQKSGCNFMRQINSKRW